MAADELPADRQEGMDPLQEYGASAVKRTWYTNNTVGPGGLSLRDKGRIDKWNNVAPVDLTRDGV